MIIPVWKRLALSCLISLIVLPVVNYAQTKQNQKKSKSFFDEALAAYRNNDFQLSEKLLLTSIQFDTLNIQAYLLLSDLSEELQNEKQRLLALQKVINIDSLHFPTAYKFSAEIYSNIGDFKQAMVCWKKYRTLSSSNDHLFIDQKIEECQNSLQLINHPINTEIFRFDEYINTSQNEYWPFISTNDSTIYFTRLINDQKKFAFERLFFSEKTDQDWSIAQQLVIGTDEMVNEGTISMNADVSLIFFTACGRPDGYGSCDIYYLLQKEGKWMLPKNAGRSLNSGFWEAQPAVSSSGKRLYFSSNRPGGFGGKDIWESEITMNENGELIFSNPINLGTGVNCNKNDFSPFIHADDQTLYFATDGRIGLGKSDLFLSRLIDSIWTPAINLGFPINSNMDDDGLVVSPTAQLAIFSSNRASSINGSKDLFLLKLPDQFRPLEVGYVKGDVYDANSKNKITADIQLVDLKENNTQLLFSTLGNGFITTLKANRTYAFNVNKQGYLFYSEHFNLTDPQKYSSATVQNIYLQPIQLDAKVVLKNIFFDFNSFLLKEESKPELEELIRFLTMNPNLKVEISGHTDNVGTEAYNQKLSENRALEIANYLWKYIAHNRIVVKGYGAQKPVDTNDTEEGRSQNRRTELRIIGN